MVNPPRNAANGDVSQEFSRRLNALRTELHRVWRRAGALPPEELARKTRRPESWFRSVLECRSLPERCAFVAFLDATGEHEQLPRWQDAWAKIDSLRPQPRSPWARSDHVPKHRSPDNRVADEPTPAKPTRSEHPLLQEQTLSAGAIWLHVLAEHTDAEPPKPLHSALHATSSAEFNRALDSLRVERGFSLRDAETKSGISKSTLHRLSKDGCLPDEDRVERLASACGEDSQRCVLWRWNRRRVAAGEPPPTWKTFARAEQQPRPPEAGSARKPLRRRPARHPMICAGAGVLVLVVIALIVGWLVTPRAAAAHPLPLVVLTVLPVTTAVTCLAVARKRHRLPVRRPQKIPHRSGT